MTRADKEVDKIKDDLTSLHERLFRFNYLASNCNDKNKEYQADKFFTLWHLMMDVANGKKID